ncbi:nitroreductase family deazaflavin-dependent oxidoreductase [Skermania sp. ID1734]|uniref:nitroreductase family deazaflavin-dependent oxidoreductase n=1 Tax=Skermania sp. ID1734 TaxID=2597516 RepID=UPI00117E73ED|nr:nitroreductase family deazaflavin-dependent oxidoreductase [Skermania sp. ID1734]TSE00095.1 nitroreductase family deazaflavin-dependent oxidoreductase [Skermania sp. ID1734]
MRTLFIQLLRLHQALYVRTDGRIGHRLLFGTPTLLLYSTGRKSGQIRTSALTYGRDGDDYLITASNGGAAKPPAWLYNLEAKPECEIQVGRQRHRVVARSVYPKDKAEYPRLWDIVNRVNHDQYREYQTKTARPIPVVVLTPVR